MQRLFGRAYTVATSSPQMLCTGAAWLQCCCHFFPRSSIIGEEEKLKTGKSWTTTILLLLSFFPSTTQTIPPFRTNSTFCYTSLHSGSPLLLCLSHSFNISSGTVGHCIHFWTTPLLHNHHLDVVAFWGLFSFCFNRPFFYRCFFLLSFHNCLASLWKKRKQDIRANPLCLIL